MCIYFQQCLESIILLAPWNFFIYLFFTKNNTNTVIHHFINTYALINNHELSVLPSYVLSNIFKCINVNQVKSESDSSSSLIMVYEPIYRLAKIYI